MAQNKEYYMDETNNVSKKMLKEKGFKFAIVTDTHLDNSLKDTISNIKAVDEIAEFRYLIHLGDFLCGNLPRNTTMKIMKKQINDFRGAIKNQRFYPVQGNHDGYYDLNGNKTFDTAIDEDWYSVISYIAEYNYTKTVLNKPYYYVDYEEEKIRLIILCDSRYDGLCGKNYKKWSGIDTAQIEWFENDALNVDSDYTVMIFSHGSLFDAYADKELDENIALQTLLKKREENGFDVACWFIGHFHGDYTKKIADVNFAFIGSQTSYIPTLWDMPKGGYFPKRQIGTVSEDLWDCCILNKSERRLKLLRFGAGADRELYY